jgi:hypothetical protein
VPLALGSAFSGVALYPCAIVLCLMTTYGVQSTFLPLYAASRGSHAGVFFTVMACAIILSRAFGGGLSDRVGRAPVATAGTVCVAAALGVTALGDGSWALVVSGLLYGFGLGAAQPALIAWCVDLAAPTERGKVMGTFYTALELGIATGAIGERGGRARGERPGARSDRTRRAGVRSARPGARGGPTSSTIRGCLWGRRSVGLCVPMRSSPSGFPCRS